ncbi:MAG: hypothetical protein M1834_001676 [Cirrosporium novae-zelandiae]|nr:MAG: hypothetical protein M1834_001676 [Cirrosporium novae-zelandiae]
MDRQLATADSIPHIPPPYSHFSAISPEHTQIPRLPPLSSALEPSLHSQRPRYDSFRPEYEGTASRGSRSSSPVERSFKRPRLHRDQGQGPYILRRDSSHTGGIMEDRNALDPCVWQTSGDSLSPQTNTSFFIPGQGKRRVNSVPKPPIPLEAKRERMNSINSPGCSNCSDLHGLVHKVIAGLVALTAELRNFRVQEPTGLINQGINNGIAPPDDIKKAGFQLSLSWAVTSIEHNTKIARQLAIDRNLSSSNMSDDKGLFRPELLGSYDNSKRKVDSADPRHDEGYKTTTYSYQENPPLFVSNFGGPEIGKSRRSRSLVAELSPYPPQSPLSNSEIAPKSLPSPTQTTSPHRVLPSPSSIAFGSISTGFPPLANSTNSNQTAHSAHLQDLQHQISTKALALETLQREHDGLLSAFSRQRTRCETLDKKSRVSENEIAVLTEEKNRLETQVSQFEFQVEQLMKSRDDAHRQSVASGAQYMQIMSMSSRLQAQGAADLKRWKSEKEGWEAEKEQYEQRIHDLESKHARRTQELEALGPIQIATENTNQEQAVLPIHEVSINSPLDASSRRPNSSSALLQGEMQRLRKRCLSFENMLLDLRGESENIDRAMELLSSIGQRIATRVQDVGMAPASSTEAPASDRLQSQTMEEKADPSVS